MTCASCNTALSPSDKFCQQCGTPAGTAAMAPAAPQYGGSPPQYAPPQYAQPQYAQPQYAQPQYGQAPPVKGSGVSAGDVAVGFAALAFSSIGIALIGMLRNAITVVGFILLALCAFSFTSHLGGPLRGFALYGACVAVPVLFTGSAMLSGVLRTARRAGLTNLS